MVGKTFWAKAASLILLVGCSGEALPGGDGSGRPPGSGPGPNPTVDGGQGTPADRDGGAPSVTPGVDAGMPNPNPIPIPVPPVTYSCSQEVEVTPGDSIEAALGGASAGTCINVRTGTYRGGFRMPSGADGAPIVLRAADGPLTVELDASGLGEPAITMIGTHMIVDGFDIVGMPTGGGNQTVVIRGGSGDTGTGVVLRNSRVTGGHNHLKINGMPVGVVVEGNEFYGNYSHIPISITGADSLLLTRNRFQGWDNGGDSAIQIKGGSRNVRVEGNIFENISGAAAALALGGGCGSSCDNDPDHWGGRNVVATNNLFLNVGRAFEGYACLDCAFIHNTVIDSRGMGKLGTATSGGTSRTTANMTILNNAFVHMSGGMGTILQVNDSAGNGLQMDNNAYYNGGSGINFGDAPQEGGRVEGDPQFQPDSYVPSEASPLTGAAATSPVSVDVDHRGDARDDAPDIGAFEG